MAQASFRAVATDVLARRIIDKNAAFRDITRLVDERMGCAAVLEELWIDARLMGIEDDVEAQIAKIQRANAKEVTG